jgi:hypothetical protein
MKPKAVSQTLLRVGSPMGSIATLTSLRESPLRDQVQANPANRAPALAWKQATIKANKGRMRRMLQVFGDESHDPKNERVFAVAAIFGTEEQWDAFRPLWTERLAGRVFHASDCETDHGEFALTTHAENLQLYADLTKLLGASKLLGFGSAMDLAGYYDFFGGAPADIPYYRCFRDVVWQCGKWAKWAIPADTAEFHFDQRVETDYNALASCMGISPLCRIGTVRSFCERP